MTYPLVIEIYYFVVDFIQLSVELRRAITNNMNWALQIQINTLEMSETEMNKFESLSSCLVITEFMVANLITYSANILSSFKVSDR